MFKKPIDQQFTMHFYLGNLVRKKLRKPFYPKLDLGAKILQNRTLNRQKIYTSSRIGPKTAQKSKTVIEPDPEPPADLSQF